MIPDPHIRTLLQLATLENLLDFLRQDLGWPIADGDVEDVTFQYEPEDVGLKPEHAPKIRSIYQIRPPSRDTPWGVFFIDFENKRLPVTLMRRILNRLRVKKTGSRLGSGWNAADLLFMTTYGEQAEGMREVAFAHFHEQAGDLPTLNVLHWDAQDTPAKLERTYKDIRQNLGWPADLENKATWREQWGRPFRHEVGHTIKTSKALAKALAELSKRICDRVEELLEAETDSGQMTKLYKAFQSALIHDLKPADFADTFAQTITYGLFSAAVSRRMPEEKGSKSLTTDTISQIIPETSPFLREVLETFIDVGGRKKGIDFDELGVQEVVELLRNDETDMRAILEDFGNRKLGEDPVVHFYENYLKAYNKDLKVKRGVFYTPQPVVSYIVRSVNELLQAELGIADGLASTITWGEMAKQNPEIKIPEGTPPDSHFVVVLDPATGTATFLVEVIDVIHRHLLAKWNSNRIGCLSLLHVTGSASHTTFIDFWNAYVPDHLLSRLYGYELMMAPYSIAHLKVGLKLRDTGFDFSNLKATDRARIYLTNALEPATELQARLALDWEALAHEAQAVKSVKQCQRFTVVIGNPPYSGVSANMSADASALVEPYKFIDGQPLGERKHWLQDDYVKFIRLGQLILELAGEGVQGIVTNHGYLDNPTFRGMRQSLIKSFNRIDVLDLHGSVKKRNAKSQSKRDENIFDIEQGVAIGLFSRASKLTSNGQITHYDLIGPRRLKYDWLSTKTLFLGHHILPDSPYYFLIFRDETNREEFDTYTGIPAIFGAYSTGVQTSRDHLAISFSRVDLETAIKKFIDPTRADEEVRQELFPGKTVANYQPGDTRQWSLAASREQIRSEPCWPQLIQQILYRPFDVRYVFYDRRMVDWPRPKVMAQLAGGRNIALLVPRQLAGESFNHVFCTRIMPEMCVISSKTTEQNNVFPLLGNLKPPFIEALAAATGQKFESGDNSADSGGLFSETASPPNRTDDAFLAPRSLDVDFLLSQKDTFNPGNVFAYIYAVLQSLGYRSRYTKFLAVDFPRIPLPGGPEVFNALVPLGAQLVALHLMESPRLGKPITIFTGLTEPRVEKVSYSEETVWLDKAQTIGFQGVPEAAWSFHIGGYQVCEKWLKDRGPKKGNIGRILSAEDIDHYQRIVVALSETIRIMEEIDKVIETHGGWPGAFQSESSPRQS